MTTLAILKSSVDSWLLRDDISVNTTHFPQVLKIAESNITRDLHLTTQETSVVLSYTSTREQDLPADYVQLRGHPYISGGDSPMEYMTPEGIHDPGVWDQYQAGMFYTLEGSPDAVANDDRVKLILSSAAGTTATLVTVNYWAKQLALSLDTDTNWLLINHFDAYLYATLTSAADWVQEFDLADRYRGMYGAVVEAQNRFENRKRYGASTKQAYNNPRTAV